MRIILHDSAVPRRYEPDVGLEEDAEVRFRREFEAFYSWMFGAKRFRSGEQSGVKGG